MSPCGSGRVKTRSTTEPNDKGPPRGLVLSPDRGDERSNAEHRDHALEIIGEDAQAHFGAHFGEALRQEVRVPHPGLQGTERMLDCSAAYRHSLWKGLESVAGRVGDMLMLPSPHTSFLARRAARL